MTLPYLHSKGESMLRVMVFIDYQNFNINLKDYYKNRDEKQKPINYWALGKEINKIIPFQSEVIKTYLFAYEPCEELKKIPYYSKYYNWLNGMRKTPYLEIIEGRQEIRTYDGIELDLNDPRTYFTEEKETDINLATHMVAKAFQNAYDIAILVSGDTDYIKVVETLHNIGKIVVIAHFPHQNVHRYDTVCDANIVLYDSILNKAVNKSYLESKKDTD